MSDLLAWLARHPIRAAFIAMSVFLSLTLIGSGLKNFSNSEPIIFYGDQFNARVGAARVLDGGLLMQAQAKQESIALVESRAFNASSHAYLSLSTGFKDEQHQINILWRNNIDPQKVYRVTLDATRATQSAEIIKLMGHSGWQGEIIGLGIGVSHPSAQALLLRAMRLDSNNPQAFSLNVIQDNFGNAMRQSPDGTLSRTLSWQTWISLSLLTLLVLALILWGVRNILSHKTALQLFAALATLSVLFTGSLSLEGKSSLTHAAVRTSLVKAVNQLPDQAALKIFSGDLNVQQSASLFRRAPQAVWHAHQNLPSAQSLVSGDYLLVFRRTGLLLKDNQLTWLNEQKPESIRVNLLAADDGDLLLQIP